ncbi:F-box protein interaction domain protein [Medicago truncatula]|uniref:F-box protein interaction domain protein n=1 Tax=Medicago truncatula TaxID=3880 RepID=G7KPD1_MEDTR|nr:F-box protein interaction domain protein [Medicago truncatula]
MYILLGDKFENKRQLNFSNPFEDDENFQIFGFGSIIGTLMLHQCCQNEHILWDPTTEKFGLIPPSTVDSYVPDVAKASSDFVSYLHGFGYDCTTNDYKIYSVRSNSWRKLDVDMPPSLKWSEGTHLYMDGVCHWLCKKSYGKHNSPFQPCLVSFYLSNEVFLVTPIHSDEDDDCIKFKASWINLAVLNGSIALFSHIEETTTFHVSILDEIGMKESWIKLFIVRPLPCVERPMGVGKKGEIFFIRKDEELVLFDLGTQMIVKLGFKRDIYPDCRIIIYK